ncbi:MAG TPA: pilus assembly protein TadG-related protein [Chloroflexota bacterium]|nr:pilus assembly protein TadG-related protein [Chloroflexota bacterium]
MKTLNSRSESGQVLIIVAAAIFFVMLGAAAVAVDIGNGFLNKQRLQNTADAAALAAAYRVASGGSDAAAVRLAAVTAAQSIVTQNTGGTVTLTDRGTGSDPNLADGIQISGNDVRVVLNKNDVKTFFAGAMGVGNISVIARSRAKVNAGGGVMPIAVKRYSAGNTLYQLGTNGNPGSVTDYLAQATNGPSGSWPGSWPLDLLVVDASPAASLAAPGPVIPILGRDAQANEAQGNDFHFWVAPDVRNITWSYPPGPTYTNGITAGSSAQDLKNLESSYFSPIRPGYNSVEGLPHQRDQVAVLNGVDTQNTVGEMEKYYGPGKYVIAMIYDGSVHRKPEFQLQVNPTLRQDNHGTLLPLDYTVTLHQTNATYPYWGNGIGLSVVGIESDFATWNFSQNPVDVAGADKSVTLTITAAHRTDPTPPATEPLKTSGARSFLIRAYDNLNHVQRTATAAVMFGNTAAYMATCSSAYQQIQQGSSGQFIVDLTGYNGYTNHTISVGSPQWEGPAPSSGTVHVGYVNHNPDSVQTTSVNNVRDGHTSTFNVYLDVDPGASTGQYILRIPMSDGSVTQNMYLSVEIYPTTSGTTVGNMVSFVYILGYAAFEIDHYTNNTVYAKAVSGLVADPSSLMVGSAVRLLGWNQ